MGAGGWAPPPPAEPPLTLTIGVVDMQSGVTDVDWGELGYRRSAGMSFLLGLRVWHIPLGPTYKA